MAFTDLPPGWEREPVRDPRRAADVLDLFVNSEMRACGALFLLLCDGRDRLVQPAAVEELPPQVGRREQFFEPFVQVLTQLTGGGALVVALARADGLSVTAADRAWQAAAYAVCAVAGVRLLGTHLLTLHGSRVLPPIAADASSADG